MELNFMTDVCPVIPLAKNFQGAVHFRRYPGRISNPSNFLVFPGFPKVVGILQFLT